MRVRSHAGLLVVLLIAATAVGQALDFTYTNTNGTITITRYTGSGGNVSIPATIDGLPVSAIGDGAFIYQTNLTGVTIPDCVTNLGDAAFMSCSRLASLTIGNGITTIPGGSQKGVAGAFAFCSSLTRVTIPDTVTSLQDGPITWGGAWGAFSGCTALTNVIVGKGLSYLGIGTFIGCTNLVAVYFRGNPPELRTDWAALDIFIRDNSPTVYYLAGTVGWGATFGGIPTKLWNPQAQTGDAGFGVGENRFGFNIAGTPGIPLVIEASTNLAAQSWVVLQSSTLTNGSIYFGDPEWTNYPSRLYRIRSP